MEEWRKKFIEQYGYDPLMSYPGGLGKGAEFGSTFPGPGPGYVMPADYTRDRDTGEQEVLTPVETVPTAAAATAPAATPAQARGTGLMDTGLSATEPPSWIPGVQYPTSPDQDQSGIYTGLPGMSEQQLVLPGEEILSLPGTDPTTPATPPANRIWAKYPYDDFTQRRLEALGKVNQNAMMLRIFAGLTGSTTAHAEEYVTNSMDRWDKTAGDKRMGNLQRVLYWNAKGEFDPPTSNEEAYERIIQARGTDAEAAALSGYLPETRTTTDLYKGRTDYIMSLEKDAKIARRNAEKAEDPATKQRYEDDAERLETRASYMRQQMGMGGFTQAQQMREFRLAWNSLMNIYTTMGSLRVPINAATGKPLTQSEFFEASELQLSKGVGTPPQQHLGWQGLMQMTASEMEVTEDEPVTARETREEYEAKVRKRHPKASEEDIQATVAAKYG